ncbi:hypothetical protein BDV32DRAFT_113740 [Aspergillus pseudonomiae]|uniref:Uncharacterized protein n=1 Tax=Aspergillus pseudonomiae TaxID=1506151 RepID=A0A5N6HN37_9EURO|nr:uncharacterized protein BDV37DRAFT_119157 [Aspergillus pseudonomiae]KAB8255274.1 hypothetical protein BDV32DRAFT_113740 [Aspergillus pseudonomiae]KAE8404150.1 hypothetical protein BDV37DRAFT_119157 [Aspergillus pseudonomiae]
MQVANPMSTQCVDHAVLQATTTKTSQMPEPRSQPKRAETKWKKDETITPDNAI